MSAVKELKNGQRVRTCGATLYQKLEIVKCQVCPATCCSRIAFVVPSLYQRAWGSGKRKYGIIASLVVEILCMIATMWLFEM